MKILMLHSSSTRVGLKRIGEILDKGGDQKIKWDLLPQWPSNYKKYDGVILHNRLDVKPDVKCAVYPCGRPQLRLYKQEADRNELISKSPRVVWTNTHTSEKLLKEVMKGIDVKCMLKPFHIVIPKECPKSPRKNTDAFKTILWYWREDWSYTRRISDGLVKLMNKLDDFDIWIIGNNKQTIKPKGAGDHVVAKGRLDIPDHRNDFVGMVRATDGLDFGRVTYQIQAFGKWALYVAWPFKELSDPFISSVRRFPDVVGKVRELSEEWKYNDCKKTYNYIKSNFTEQALRKKWENEINRVFK